MTTDNTQVGLKKLCEAFIDGDISAGQFKRVVRIWHNKQVEAVLDRLQESTNDGIFLDLERAIEAERKRIKERR